MNSYNLAALVFTVQALHIIMPFYYKIQTNSKYAERSFINMLQDHSMCAGTNNSRKKGYSTMKSLLHIDNLKIQCTSMEPGKRSFEFSSGHITGVHYSF